ncbi:MAG: 4-hydroxy-3-methylbut-2-enyl diphosphate reductase, partial [Acetatifactor sp.]|nr:4-hydroxy-3-methylbut-2-enyl diphosphate reductase [Acetatifactor sp.]
MEIKLAEHTGFCFGVRRAVDTVYEQVKTGKTIYTYGPIVNNEEVVRELGRMGVQVLESREELERLETGSVIIRAHGVSEEIYRLLEEKGLECIDATCPFVKRIHRIVEQESAEGSHIVVIGNAGHPEVEGIVGWCRGDVTVLEEPEDADKFIPSPGEKLCVVAQTTYNYNKFHYIVEIF